MKLTNHDPSYFSCSNCDIKKDHGIVRISQLRLNLGPAVDCCHLISFLSDLQRSLHNQYFKIIS